jgi:hypothetical protein
MIAFMGGILKIEANNLFLKQKELNAALLVTACFNGGNY